MTNETEKKITAKFSGKCTKCGGVVPSGTQCLWSKGAGVSHVTCPESVVEIDETGEKHWNGRSDDKQVSVTMGVFKKDGRIYVVKPNREKTRVYAKEVIESPARMTENGSVADFETVYRPGVVFQLTEADRWDIADAQDFLTKFSKCIVCGRHLKAATSVARSIGPVCVKYFAHNKTYTAQPVVKLADVKKAAVIVETDEQTIDRLAAKMQANTPLMLAADDAAREQAALDVEDAWKKRQIARAIAIEDAAPAERAEFERETGELATLLAQERSVTTTSAEIDEARAILGDREFELREQHADIYENDIIYGDA